MNLTKIEEEVIKLMRQGADVELYLADCETETEAKEFVKPIADLVNEDVRRIHAKSDIVGDYFKTGGIISDESYGSVSVMAFMVNRDDGL